MSRVVFKYRVITTAETGMKVTVHCILRSAPRVSGEAAADMLCSVLELQSLPELLIQVQR